jgi:hypothetical protein
VIVTVLAPRLALAPATGDCVTTKLELQLSAATTPAVKSGTSAVQAASAETVWSAAQLVMPGAVVSTTVKVAVHVVVLPAASATVIVTVLAPRLALAPATGDCVTTRLELQLSAATTPTVKSGTSAVQAASAEAVWSAAQLVMPGAVVSTTSNVLEHVVVLPAASATTMVIAVEPRLAVEPASGDCVMVRDELQLSLATTVAVKSGTKAVHDAPAGTVCAGAQVAMVGAVVSTPVKVVVQLAVLPAASATVTTTLVAPRPTSVPAAGDCVVETTAQLSADTVVAVKSGRAIWQLAPTDDVWAGAQDVIVGLAMSWIV